MTKKHILKAIYHEMNDFQDETLCAAAEPDLAAKGYTELLEEHHKNICDIISRWQLKIIKSVLVEDYDQYKNKASLSECMLERKEIQD